MDATPLIYLAKVNKLHLVKNIESERIIPESVYNEVVVEGKRQGKPDAEMVEKLVKEGVFKVEALANRLEELQRNQNLSKADVDVLSMAKLKNGIAILDDEYARKIAEIEGIENKGTLYLIFFLLRKGSITKSEAREIVDAMIEKGWYCSTDLYVKILKKIESFRN